MWLGNPQCQNGGQVTCSSHEGLEYGNKGCGCEAQGASQGSAPRCSDFYLIQALTNHQILELEKAETRAARATPDSTEASIADPRGQVSSPLTSNQDKHSSEGEEAVAP